MNPRLCKQTGGNQGDYRFTIEQEGKNVLFVIGLNPSTANESLLDNTMKKVIRFAENAGYDGFVMLNLSCERSTNKHLLAQSPDEAHHRTNMETISELSTKYPTADILVAFGNDIAIRPYLKNCFRDIHDQLKNHGGHWKKIGNLTVRGNPRHPLYARYAWGLTDFNAGEYVARRC